jgi:hypothetical protein
MPPEISAALSAPPPGWSDFRVGDVVRIVSGSWMLGDVRRVAGFHHSAALIYLDPKEREHPRSCFIQPDKLRLEWRG